MRFFNAMFGMLLFAAMLVFTFPLILCVVYVLGWVICIGCFIRLAKEEMNER